MLESFTLKAEVVGSEYSGLEIYNVGLNNIVGFHAHLLGDGDHSVRFSLLDDVKIIDSVEEIISLEGATDFHTVVRDALISNGTPLVFEDTCDSSFYPYDDDSIKAWFDKPNARNVAFLDDCNV